MISTHKNTQHSVFMISTINCMEACDVNGLSRKILGKSDSFTLKKNKKQQQQQNTHTHTHKKKKQKKKNTTLKMTFRQVEPCILFQRLSACQLSIVNHRVHPRQTSTYQHERHMSEEITLKSWALRGFKQRSGRKSDLLTKTPVKCKQCGLERVHQSVIGD